MKKTAVLLSFTIAALAACNSAPENKEAPKPVDTVVAAPAPPPELDSATKAKNWMEAMTPGEMHKMLAMAEGKWNTEMTSWMAEGAPPDG